jgi:hypothetical protein
MPLYIRYVFARSCANPPTPHADPTPADAVPKKRGPKTDVLEALLKRVDGLEARLKDKKTEEGSESPENGADNAPETSTSTQPASNAIAGVRADIDQELEDTKMFSPIQQRSATHLALPSGLV